MAVFLRFQGMSEKSVSSTQANIIKAPKVSASQINQDATRMTASVFGKRKIKLTPTSKVKGTQGAINTHGNSSPEDEDLEERMYRVRLQDGSVQYLSENFLAYALVFRYDISYGYCHISK